jgi:hypothetical protein
MGWEASRGMGLIRMSHSELLDQVLVWEAAQLVQSIQQRLFDNTVAAWCRGDYISLYIAQGLDQ